PRMAAESNPEQRPEALGAREAAQRRKSGNEKCGRRAEQNETYVINDKRQERYEDRDNRRVRPPHDDGEGRTAENNGKKYKLPASHRNSEKQVGPVRYVFVLRRLRLYRLQFSIRCFRFVETILAAVDDQPFRKHHAPSDRQQKYRGDKNPERRQLDEHIARDVVAGHPIICSEGHLLKRGEWQVNQEQGQDDAVFKQADQSEDFLHETGHSRTSLSRVGENHVRRLFRDHVDWHDHEESRDSRKHRRVNNTQSLCAVHPEVAAQDAALLLRSDVTCARSVMAPGAVLHKLIDAGVTLEIDAFHDFGMELQHARSIDQLI